MTTAGAQPTGNDLVDTAYRAFAGAVVTMAASRSRRWTWAVAALALFWMVPTVPERIVAAAAVAVSGLAMAKGRRRDVGAVVGVLVAFTAARLGVGALPESFTFHGSSTLFAVIAIGPILVSALVNVSAGPRQFILRASATAATAAVGATLIMVVVAILAASPFGDGVDATRDGFDAASDGDDGAAVEHFGMARQQLSDARRLLTGPWTVPAQMVPILAQHVQVVRVAVDESVMLSTSAEAAAASISVDDLRVVDGQIDLGLIDAAEPVLAQVSRSLVEARRRITVARSPWLLAAVNNEIESFVEEIDRVLPGAEIAALAAREAPTMLGANRSVRWLVLATNPSEARGTSGPVANLVTVVIDNGTVRIEQSLRNEDINALLEQNQAILNASADYSSRWAQFRPERVFQDVTLSPDLPDVGAVAADLFTQATGNPVDGVIVIDPYAIAGLLELTGPVTLGELRLTSANAANYLLRQQYIDFADDELARVVTFAALLEATFSQLIEGALPAPRALGRSLGPFVREGRLGAWWTADGEANDLLARAGLDQEFPELTDEPDGDLIGIIHQNQGQNKIDAYLEQAINYQRDSTADPSRTEATITVELTNTAPSEGLPLSVIGSNDQALPIGTNRLQLSVYSRLTPQKVTVNGVEVPVTSQVEFGVNVVTTSLDIAAGATVAVVVVVAGPTPPSSEITVVRQPLVNPGDLTVAVDGRAVISPGSMIANRTTRVLFFDSFLHAATR